MSSCLSGGGRAYGFDLEIVKSPSTSTITSQTSSSTLSESSNSPLVISTRKPRTPRKRPNQTYNEAASLLSTACPNIFSPKNFSKPFKFSKPYDHFIENKSSDLLLPFRVFDNTGFLIHQPIPEKPNSRIELRVGKFRDKSQNSSFSGGFLEDFDAESMLDEEIEEGGIDSIMGNLSVENNDDANNFSNIFYEQIGTTCYGYPMGLGLGGEFGCSRAFRHVDEGEWWRFPQIDIVKFSPKLITKAPIEKKKKKVENLLELKCLVPQETNKENPIPKQEKEKENGENSVPISNPALLLKLNFDDVANAWSDRGSPFSDEISGQETTGGDLQARLALIDLFSEENGGVREARVLRYKEKRRTRLFSKKIRYQVRKVNADQRPRMKKQRVSDAAGDHDSFCQGAGRLIRRHNLVRDKLFALAREARLAPRLEVGHLIDGDSRRPADILFPSWDNGRDLCLDVSIVSPFTLLPSIAGVGEAARKAEERKMAKYEAECASHGLLFLPFVMESTGGFGQRSVEVLSRLAVELASIRGVTPAESLASVRQQLSFTAQKALADGFLIRSGDD